MRTNRLFFVCAIISLAAGLRLYTQSSTSVQNDLGFPFEIMSERRIKGIREEQQAAVFIDRKHYSKANLDKVFNWFCARFPEEALVLSIQVAADKSLLETKPYPHHFDDRPVAGIATFTREKRGAWRNETIHAWYRYSPNLDLPDERKTVVLKGKDPHAIHKYIEEKEVAHDNLRFKFASYKLLNTEPGGTYYGFYYAQSTSKSWDELFTIRFDEVRPIPTNQIRLLNGQTTFAFLGWIYAITMNGGQTWSVWNAEKDFPGWACCDPNLIQAVEIRLDGSGSMTLNLKHQKSQELQILHTRDYGQHWTQ